MAKFIGSPNVDAQKVIHTMEREGRYFVPVHEFWKAALLGEFAYYDPVTSLALNLFDVTNPNPTEHFLLPMVLAFLQFDGPHRSKEGFVDTESIVSEMQSWSFTPSSTEDALRRANNKELIETSQRVTFAEEVSGLHGDMPASFRISTIGAYHLKRWMTEFAYLDAMTYDTPILDPSIRNILRPNINSLAIEDRYERALNFRDFITATWRSSSLKPRYFDWLAMLPAGQRSFERVQRAIERNKAASQMPH